MQAGQGESTQNLISNDDNKKPNHEWEDEPEEEFYSPPNGVLVCLLVLIFLASCGVGVGIYYLIDGVTEDDSPSRSLPTLAPVAPVAPAPQPTLRPVVPPTPAPVPATLSPTQSPTKQPTRTDAEIIDLLETVVGESIRQSGTPQELAALWLIESDPRFVGGRRLQEGLFDQVKGVRQGLPGDSGTPPDDSGPPPGDSETPPDDSGTPPGDSDSNPPPDAADEGEVSENPPSISGSICADLSAAVTRDNLRILTNVLVEDRNTTTTLEDSELCFDTFLLSLDEGGANQTCFDASMLVGGEGIEASRLSIIFETAYVGSGIVCLESSRFFEPDLDNGNGDGESPICIDLYQIDSIDDVAVDALGDIISTESADLSVNGTLCFGQEALQPDLGDVALTCFSIASLLENPDISDQALTAIFGTNYASAGIVCVDDSVIISGVDDSVVDPVDEVVTTTVCADLSSIDTYDAAAESTLTSYLGQSEAVLDGTNLCFDSKYVVPEISGPNSTCVDALTLLNDSTVNDEILTSIFGSSYSGAGVACLTKAAVETQTEPPVANSTLCVNLRVFENVNDNALGILSGILGNSEAELIDGEILCFNSTDYLVDDPTDTGLTCFDVISLINSPLVTDATVGGFFGSDYKGDGTLCVDPDLLEGNDGESSESSIDDPPETSIVCIEGGQSGFNLDTSESVADIEDIFDIVQDVTGLSIAFVNSTNVCLDSELIEGNLDDLDDSCASILDQVEPIELVGFNVSLLCPSANITIPEEVCVDLNLVEGITMDAAVVSILDTILEGTGARLESTFLCLNATVSEDYTYTEGENLCLEVLDLLQSPLVTDESLGELFGEDYESGTLCVDVTPEETDEGVEGPSALSLLSDEEIVQRYLLVLFYYQTTDVRTNFWQSQCGAPEDVADGRDECSYIQNAKLENGRINGESQPRINEISSKWLTAASECEWAGVVCSSDGEVQQLSLAEFGLKGTLPTEILELPDLGWVDFSYNLLSGTLPIDYFKKLQSLQLNNNTLTGNALEAPESWEDASLLFLNVGDNDFQGSLPQFVGESTHELWAYSNGLEGSIPPSLMAEEQSLRLLSVADNALEGAVPHIGTLDSSNSPKLEYIDLSMNDFTGSLSVNSNALTSLRVAENNIEGKVPTDLAESTRLKHLDLSTNKFFEEFFGGAPAGIDTLTQLTSLKLSDNFFFGILPSSLAALTGLTRLELGRNDLRGAIPEEFALLTKLEVLDLSFNNLEGQLSPSLGQLSNIEQLLLEDNFFNGIIPTQLLRLADLSVFTFNENDLTGTLPAGFCSDDYNLEFLVGDCNEVQCDCCTVCCSGDGVCSPP